MRLKSLMLTPTLIGLSGLTAYASLQIAQSAQPLAWFGVAMAAAPLPGLVLYLMARQSMARTSPNLMPALALAGGGVAVAALGGAGLVPFAWATISAVLLLWYVFVYSRLDRSASGALKVGQTLPEFVLEEASGVRVHSAEFLGRPTLLLFYRGNWCPLCMAQIGEVAAAYRRLADEGVEVALVSPQPAHETAKLAAKFDVPFRFLVDPGLGAAKALGIAAQGGVPLGVDAMGYGTDTVLPTIVATDAQGTILFLDETDNYRVRPEPETFLNIFHAAQTTQMEVA